MGYTDQERARRRAEEAQRVQRRTDVWELRCKGWKQERIARQFGVSQSTISRDLKWAAARALSNLEEAVRQTKVEQVSQLNHILDEALQSWEKSKQAGKSVSKKERGGTRNKLNGTNEEIITRVEEKSGDTRYLTVAMKAMEDVRKILGADAPLKTQVSGPDDGPIVLRQEEEDPDRIAEILSVLAEVGALPPGAD